MDRIPVSRIFPNPDQPRKIFDAAALTELAASIRENGLLQPITVRPAEDGRYMIVAGERRWRACSMLAEAGGAEDVPCLIYGGDDRQLDIDAIIENDQRVDVTPMEQARSYQRMIDVHGYDEHSLAAKLGKPVVRVTEKLRLLNLTEECAHLLERGQLYFTQAYELAGLSPAGQAKLLRQINTGQCRTVTALKAIAATIAEAEAQIGMFADEPPPPTSAEVSAARGFEAKVEQVAAMLRAGIDDNVVTAVKRVDPGRAATLAELMAQMQRDLHRIESAFRVAAVQVELAA